MVKKSNTSKILKSLCLVAVLSLSHTAFAQQVNILFIGNSFTARHDLPGLVKKVFEEGHPGMTVYTQKIIYGGQEVYMHATYYSSQSFIEESTISKDTINARIAAMQGFLNLTTNPPEYQAIFDTLGKLSWFWPKSADSFKTRFVNINTAISRHQSLLTSNPQTKWDYVVLQGWRDLYPSLDQGYALGVRRILKSVQAQGAKCILYLTAPNNQNATSVTAPVEQRIVDNDISVAKMLADSIHPFAVVPVSLGINTIQNPGTNLTFRYVNDFHPNNRSAYLAANMFYAAVFKQSTEGFHFDSVAEDGGSNLAVGTDPDGGPLITIFAGDEKLLLQRTASRPACPGSSARCCAGGRR